MKVIDENSRILIRIRIRIHTKMSWIRKTDFNRNLEFEPGELRVSSPFSRAKRKLTGKFSAAQRFQRSVQLVNLYTVL